MRRSSVEVRLTHHCYLEFPDLSDIGFGRLFDHHVSAKDCSRHLNDFSTDPTSEEMAFGIERAPYTGTPSFHRNSADSSASTPGLTRCNSLATCLSPPTPNSAISPTETPSPIRLPIRIRPSGTRRRLTEQEPIHYDVEEIRAAAKELCPEAYPSDAASTSKATDPPRATPWAGYTGDAPDLALAPSHEFVGEGSYKISKYASKEQVLDAFSASQWPLGPLIVTFTGKDRKVPGHDFTYGELNHELYERSTAAATRKDFYRYTVEKNEEGAEIQKGFPFLPPNQVSPGVVPGHVGADWHSPLPRVREWDFIHNKECPGLTGSAFARLASRAHSRRAPWQTDIDLLNNAIETPLSAEIQDQAPVPYADPPRTREEYLSNILRARAQVRFAEDPRVPEHRLSTNVQARPHVHFAEDPRLSDDLLSTNVQAQSHVRFANLPHVREEQEESSEEDDEPPQDIMVERPGNSQPRPILKRRSVAASPRAARAVTIQRVPVPSPKVLNRATRYHPDAMVRIVNPGEENAEDACESCS